MLSVDVLNQINQEKDLSRDLFGYFSFIIADLYEEYKKSEEYARSLVLGLEYTQVEFTGIDEELDKYVRSISVNFIENNRVANKAVVKINLTAKIFDVCYDDFIDVLRTYNLKILHVCCYKYKFHIKFSIDYYLVGSVTQEVLDIKLYRELRDYKFLRLYASHKSVKIKNCINTLNNIIWLHYDKYFIVDAWVKDLISELMGLGYIIVFVFETVGGFRHAIDSGVHGLGVQDYILFNGSNVLVSNVGLLGTLPGKGNIYLNNYTDVMVDILKKEYKNYTFIKF